MIKSVPRKNALFSIGVFLVISYSIAFLNLNYMLKGSALWYNQVFFWVFFPFATIILLRQVLKYKVITIQKQTIKVKYPFRLKAMKSNVKNIEAWQEIIIDTKNSKFKQLEILFLQAGKLTLSNQENSNYEDVLKFLNKNASKVKVTTS